jgi:hypothetical protein
MDANDKPVKPANTGSNVEEEVAADFQLGDRIYIEGGRLDNTRGRIYYMDDDLIRILPEGAPDRLVDIPLVDGDLAEELGIENFYLVSKRANPAFVAQIDAHVGDIADTFGQDGSLGIQYKIKEVNEAEDFLVLEDETGGDLKVECAFRGIPREEAFVVLRPRQKASATPSNSAESKEPEQPKEEEEAEDDFFKDIDVGEQEEEDEVLGLVERPAAMRTYPDRIQRDEMFRNLLEALPLREQKIPAVQREIRQFVEQCMLMRNAVVEYDATGEPIGRISTSYQTIAELLKKGDIPLARPVLESNRTLYLDTTEDNPIEAPGIAVNLEYMNKNVEESNQYLDTQLGGAAGVLTTPDALPQWFLTWETFFQRFMQPWSSKGEPGETVMFQGDKEFLRAPVADGLEPAADGLPKPALEPRTAAVSTTADSIGNVRAALQKGLGPRITRLKDKQPLRRVESGDEGVIQSQLLFPLKVQRDLGLIRSGSIAKDIAFGFHQTKTLLDILKLLEGIPQEATAGGILSVGPEGNTLGNIAIEDWLKAQPLRIRGLGDALVEIKNMGLAQKELTADQQAVLVDKVRQLRATVVGTIITQHTESERQRAALRLEGKPLLQGEALEELMTVLSSEPQLLPRIEELQSLLPAYKENDIAIVAGICVKAADLFLTTMAGVPGPLARERNRRARDTFLETLRQTLLKIVKRENAGQEPQPIHCPHVRSLHELRKVRDTDDRMKLFAKFLARFQGPRKDNWIQCAASARGDPHNLVCYHEVLLLQEYLHPKEKDTIHKELLLAFSGGVFHGRYICKNCGQAISQLDFEQNIEFDDNGRPMSGRSVLVDKDEIQSEEFRLLLGAPSSAPERAEFANDTQRLIYTAARQIFDVIGIYVEKESYNHIIERVESEVVKQPSREDYTKLLKARERAGKGESKPLDYDVLINRILVSAVAAHVLIEIQTHVPDFVIRSKIPGCVAGFTGFPLGKEEDKTGINYISCAVAAIKRNEAPWNLTGFLLQPNDKKRQEMIAASVFKLAADAVKTASVQQLVSVKRAYYEKLYGSAAIGTQLPEFVIPRFRPTPYYVTPEEATKDIVVPAAANEGDLARAWIQAAHRIARENGNFVRGSPYSETSSCFTPIGNPRGFWKEKEATMPPLPEKESPHGQSGSQVTLHFTPRKIARLLAEPPEDLFYRVFLRVCYDGPRKGLPHEPGYTHKCMSCGFVFPEDPYTESPAPPLVKDLFTLWQTEVDSIITKGKSALESQKVLVTKDTFQDVLDSAHTHLRVTPITLEKPLAGLPLLDRLARLDPEPFDGWRQLMAQTMERVAKLTPNPDAINIADAYGPMSDFVAAGTETIERRLGETSLRAMRRLFEQSPSQVTESIRTYFLVPFQRLLKGFHTDSLRVSKKYGLPVPTREDIDKAIKDHLAYLTPLSKHVKGYTALKLEAATAQLTRLLPIVQNEIRAMLVPGGVTAIPYIVGSLLMGVLLEFVNPNIVPSDGGATGGAYEPTARVPLNILEVCLGRFQVEGLVFSEDQIRDMIARRVEAEKMTFINKLDRLSPEEKKTELMKKRLGLGEWAVGGTKAIFSLDPDQYERERVQRIEMGVGDFVTGAEAEAAGAAAQDDAFGGGGAGAEGGYTVDQMDADDY